MGLFITMEGPDGSGKSTQIELLRDYLSGKGYDIIICREPGGTKISEAIRQVILNKDFTAVKDLTEDGYSELVLKLKEAWLEITLKAVNSLP